MPEVSSDRKAELIPKVIENFVIKTTHYVEDRDTGKVLYEGTEEACFRFVINELDAQDTERLQDGIVKYPEDRQDIPVHQFDDDPDVSWCDRNGRDRRIDWESDLEVFPYPYG